MNIVYNCNEKFAVHTAVSITSLFENNRDADSIHVYILGNGLSQDSVQKFSQLTDASHKITIIDLRDYESVLRMLFGEALDTGGFDVTVLARIFAPSHLPDEVDRYIYLDADTIVRSSLKELYQLDLQGKICAMAAEPTIYQDTRKKLELSDTEPYFNSGMLLVDRLKWEAERITAECIEYYQKLGGNGLSFPDQDIINYCLKGRIQPCGQKYNFFSNYHYQSYQSLVSRAEWYKKVISKSEYEDAHDHPAVVHFAGAERPWIKGNRNPYRAEYHKYLAHSPWKGTQDISGQEMNMRLYHVMNMITLYCPWARQLISGLYYRIRFGAKN